MTCVYLELAEEPTLILSQYESVLAVSHEDGVRFYLNHGDEERLMGAPRRARNFDYSPCCVPLWRRNMPCDWSVLGDSKDCKHRLYCNGSSQTR